MKTQYAWFPPLDRLYGAKDPIDIARYLHQGDIFRDVVCCRFPYRDTMPVEPKQPHGYAMVLGHPCEISVGEKGDVQPWRTLCAVFEDRDRRLTLDGETHFLRFPCLTYERTARFGTLISGSWLQYIKSGYNSTNVSLHSLRKAGMPSNVVMYIIKHASLSTGLISRKQVKVCILMRAHNLLLLEKHWCEIMWEGSF